MSDQQYKKLKRALFLLSASVLALIVIILINLITDYRHHKNITLIKGDKGDTAQIDYEYIRILVKEEVSKIPVMHGTDGVNGSNGINGQNGKDGANGLNGLNGLNGIDGLPGDTVELRTNPKTGDLEWKYTSDDLWTILILKCLMMETCEQ